jgi:hypothetical protein
MEEAAQAEFALAVKSDVSNSRRANIHDIIAWGWFLRGKPALGLADAEQAVALAPNETGILYTRGQIYLAQGKIGDLSVDAHLKTWEETAGQRHGGKRQGRVRASRERRCLG